jgi:hypothetical protein
MLSLLIGHGSAVQAEDRPVSEYSIKAAYLYNLSGFVSWPEPGPQHNDEFRLCVLGNDPFGEVLDTLSGKPVHGRSLKVRRLTAAATIDTCHLVYISESEIERYAILLGMIRSRPVLTVSDIDGFALHGGIIRFKLVDNRVRLEINPEAAERAGLKISSKLLSLATIVSDEMVTAR